MTGPRAHTPSRVPLVIVSLCLAAVLAVLGWTATRVKPDHFAEAARARELLDRGRIDDALAAVSGIHDDGPGAPEALTVAARALLMRNAVSPARLALERSISLKPDQAEAAKLLAAIYIAGGDGQRGVEMLRKAARLDPRDFRPWFALGKLHHDMGELDESIRDYTQALERSPPPAEARASRLGRARALLDANRPEQASEDLAWLRERSPDDSEILALSARQARDQGRPEEAGARADAALAADPANFDALLVRARLQFAERRPDRAIADLKKALEGRPNDVATLQLLLQAQKTAGLTRDAEATLELANRARERVALMDRLTKDIDRNPRDPVPRWRMGQEAMDGGQYILAFQCFRAALDLDPKFRPAHQALEVLQSKKGFDYQAAVKLQLQVPAEKPPGRR